MPAVASAPALQCVDGAAEAGVFGGDGQSLLEQGVPDEVDVPAERPLGADENPPDGPFEIDRGRAGALEVLGGGLEPGQEVAVRDELGGQYHAVRGGDADGRGAPDGQPADGVPDGHRVAAFDVHLILRQASLIEQPQIPAAGVAGPRGDLEGQGDVGGCHGGRVANRWRVFKERSRETASGGQITGD